MTMSNKKSVRYAMCSGLASGLLLFATPSQSATFPIYSDVFTTSYNESQSLSFGYQYNGIGYTQALGSATVSGDLNVRYAQTSPKCVYFQLSGSNLTAEYEGTSVGIPAFTSPWCQYLGTAINCPVYQTANFDIDGITSSLGISLGLTAVNPNPSFTINWYESMVVTVIAATPSYTEVLVPAVPGYNVCIWPGICQSFPGTPAVEETIPGTPAVTASESYNINFPGGGFSTFVTSNILSAASQGSHCAPPT